MTRPAAASFVSRKSSVGATRKATLEAYAVLPLSFEANRGQVNREVKFLTRGNGYTLFLTPSETVLALHRAQSKSGIKNVQSEARNAKLEMESGLLPTPDFLIPVPETLPPGPQASSVLRMRLLGANPAPRASGLDELPGRTNYFIGNDAKKWRTNIPNYTKVRYEGVYPGIDLIYYGNKGQLENDFVVEPGANPGAIILGFDGATRISLGPSGELILGIGGGEVLFRKPRVYQRAGTTQQPVPACFVLQGPDKVGFEVGPHDPTIPLIIDPVLTYSSYLGGGNLDEAFGVAVDTSVPSNIYMTGFTQSTDFPLMGPLASDPSLRGSSDAFVTKLNPNATGSAALVYSTYLGGSSTDQGAAITVDASGNAYVAGVTQSADFPLVNPLPAPSNTLLGVSDAFVAKLNSTGSALLYSTYLGGTNSDQATAIALDSSGNAYVTGFTSSADFPLTAGVFQITLKGPTNAFVTKLNLTGSTLSLTYSTYLGGSGGDKGLGIAIDNAAPANAYVTGFAGSSDFPTAGISPLQTVAGGQGDAFVTKVNPTGSGLAYSTYLGGSSLDEGNAIAVDSSGNAYVTGFTSSANFPLVGAVQESNGGGTDAFVVRINSLASALLYSTYLGGQGSDVGNGIVVDASGNAYVTGQTASFNFPSVNPFQVAFEVSDAFVAELSPTPTGTSLVYSSYLGGGSVDAGNGIALDSSGNVYVAGSTQSTDFPTVSGSFQTSPPALMNGFVAKVGPGSGPAVTLTSTSLSFGDQTVGTASLPETVTLRDIGSAPLTISPIVASGDFSETNTCLTGLAGGSNCAINVTFSPTARGSRSGTVTIPDNASGSPQTITLSGNGIIPGVTLTPSTLTFPNQAVNTVSAPETVTLANTGSDPLTLNAIQVKGDFSQPSTNNTTCPGTVLAGASCTISIVFTPTSPLTRTGTMLVYDDATGSPQSVQLTGTGVGPAATLSTSSLVFGEQPKGTTSGPQTFTLSNTGNGPMTISAVTPSGAAFGVNNNCGASLAAGNNCTFTVTFKPQTAGATSGAVTIGDNAPGSPQQVTFTGTAVAGPAPEAFLSSSLLSLGLQPVTTTSMAQPLTLMNTGNAALAITTIAVSGDFAETNNCGNQVAAAASCTISITFTPTRIGIRAGTVTVTDNASGSPHTAVVSGTGIDFALTAPTASASIDAGQTATYNVTLTPLNGYNQGVSFTCNGAPLAATCTVTPASVTLDGTAAATVKVAVATTARSLGTPGGPRLPLIWSPSKGPARLLWILALFALGTLAAMVARRFVAVRLWPAWGGIVVLLLCGACGVGSQKPIGTLAGSYTVTLTGASSAGNGALTHKLGLILIVK